jgi:hypothetical protein
MKHRSVLILSASFLLVGILNEPGLSQTTGGKGTITRGMDTTSIHLEAYDYSTPQAGGAEDISATQTSVVDNGLKDPPEPSLSHIDNICGILPDDRLRVRDPIFSNEISGCLLGFRPERVTQAPQGRGSRAPQPPGPGRIIDRVIELVAAPELDIAPSEIGLTGLETYVWIDEPAAVSVSAAAGGTTVDARAFPSQYLWDWGDGNDTLTYDSGQPWSRNRPGSIEHIYETRGRYDLSVEVVWEAQWRINGGAWQALGFFSLGDSVDYPVRQIQARLTRTNN